ncbi:hypothetical protein N7462_001670 [Penicillium macrosclerotiorum]|uniref:uncharacterized protein n=1 Tax=Penicillium macrosclerotiorum TaxID=303699 RepID=UPI0025498C15|nr:uncharacterized protein N7462_001670 [Penicillium macrosclerotiorum]KAJ5692247.1 hypothetical protein N7462_001670 [Penicillium macrosclerotiorum]
MGKQGVTPSFPIRNPQSAASGQRPVTESSRPGRRSATMKSSRPARRPVIRCAPGAVETRRALAGGDLAGVTGQSGAPN